MGIVRFALSVVALGAGLAATALAADHKTAPKRVPEAAGIRIDMSLDEARKALPNATWIDSHSAYTGKVIAITARDAWTLAGQSYTLKMTTHRREPKATMSA